MRFVKILGWSILSVLTLLVLGAAAIVLLVNPNDYKDQIARAVKARTGRELRLEGGLGLQVFPWLRWQVGHARARQIPRVFPYPLPPRRAGVRECLLLFASIKQADIGVRLLPLLRRRLEVRRVRLNGLQLNLMVNAGGKNNWEDLTWKAGDKPEAGDETGRGVEIATVAGLTVKTRSRLPQRAIRQHWRVSGLDLKPGSCAPASPWMFR